MDQLTPATPASFEGPTPDETTVTASNTTSATRVAEEDDVFDPSAYVKDLIARMDGNKPATKAGGGAAQVAPTKRTKTEADAKANESSTGATTGRASHRPTRAEEIGLSQNVVIDPRRARIAAPQPPVDLEKLREAANITSYSDLHVSARHIFMGRAYADLALALGCGANALVMLTLAQGAASVAYLASIASLIVAGAVTARFTRTARELSGMANHQQNLTSSADTGNDSRQDPAVEICTD